MDQATKQRTTAGQRGFSFIEILVVMGIIAVLTSMVVVVIPVINENAAQAKSTDNVKNLITLMMVDTAGGRTNKWPRFSGKNFILSLVASGKIDPDNVEQLQGLFSPGDTDSTFDDVEKDRYEAITKETLKQQQDNSALTSYAGRRNGDKEFRITPTSVKKGEIIISDDDQGAVHHPDGIIIGTLNGSASYKSWEDLGLEDPEDPDNPDPFLGDDSPNELLRKLLGQ